MNVDQKNQTGTPSESRHATRAKALLATVLAHANKQNLFSHTHPSMIPDIVDAIIAAAAEESRNTFLLKLKKAARVEPLPAEVIHPFPTPVPDNRLDYFAAQIIGPLLASDGFEKIVMSRYSRSEVEHELPKFAAQVAFDTAEAMCAESDKRRAARLQKLEEAATEAAAANNTPANP